MSRRGGLRLVPVAGAAWAAALLTVFVPALAGWTAAALWLAALGLVTAGAIRARGTRRGGGMPRPPVAVVVLMLALAAAAGTASHVAFALPARAAVSALALDGGRAVEVVATTTGKVERRADGTVAFDAVTARFTTGARSERLRADVVVRVAPGDVDRPELLDVGAAVRVDGTAAGARPGERAAIVLWARTVEVAAAPSGAAATAAALRGSLVAAVAGLPGPGAGLVPGLAVGDTSAVSADLDRAMKESSLSHLTAVSGANCALVVAIAFGLTAAIGGSRRIRVLIGLAALCGFVTLVTPEPSVVRAGVMAAVSMLALLLGRPGAGMSVLSLSVAVLLIADPWLASSLGFALSVVATASLLLFTRPFASGLTRLLPRPLALALAVPLAAQLACGPLLVLVSPAVPVFGVLANLLATPAAPIATVVGLAACLAAPLPWLQQGLSAIAWLPATWIAATATTVADLPAGALPWIEGWPGVAALAAVGAAVGVCLAPIRPDSSWLLLRRAVQRLSLLVVAVVAGIAVGTAALGTVAARWTLPREWAVLACDVGQGDAVLLRSAGAVALVDTGPEPEALAGCLARAGVDRIDLLVLTHFDLDHAGGASAIEGRVGTVLHGPPTPDDDRVLGALQRSGAHLRAASEGLQGVLGDARWRVLWPRARSAAFPSGNDASVVLEVEGGGIPRTLLLGDLSASPQRALATSGGISAAYDVVKVAHHGSADQDAGLYALIDPALALVTVGADNDYGHPRAEILSILGDGGARVARTDREGMIAIWSRGDELALWREHGVVDGPG